MWIIELGEKLMFKIAEIEDGNVAIRISLSDLERERYGETAINDITAFQFVFMNDDAHNVIFPYRNRCRIDIYL